MSTLRSIYEQKFLEIAKTLDSLWKSDFIPLQCPFCFNDFFVKNEFDDTGRVSCTCDNCLRAFSYRDSLDSIFSYGNINITDWLDYVTEQFELMKFMQYPNLTEAWITNNKRHRRFRKICFRILSELNNAIVFENPCVIDSFTFSPENDCDGNSITKTYRIDAITGRWKGDIRVVFELETDKKAVSLHIPKPGIVIHQEMVDYYDEIDKIPGLIPVVYSQGNLPPCKLYDFQALEEFLNCNLHMFERFPSDVLHMYSFFCNYVSSSYERAVTLKMIGLTIPSEDQ